MQQGRVHARGGGDAVRHPQVTATSGAPAWSTRARGPNSSRSTGLCSATSLPATSSPAASAHRLLGMLSHLDAAGITALRRTWRCSWYFAHNACVAHPQRAAAAAVRGRGAHDSGGRRGDCAGLHLYALHQHGQGPERRFQGRLSRCPLSPVVPKAPRDMVLHHAQDQVHMLISARVGSRLELRSCSG